MTTFKVALALATTAGCMLSPTDDGRVTSTTAPLPFYGYVTQPAAPVQVRAWDFTTHVMANIGAPVAATTSPTGVDGGPLYSWSASRTLPAQFWRTGPAGGQCAGVGARATISGSTYDVISVESDWADCWAEHPNVGEFYSECRSDHSPVAKIYTTSWGSIAVPQSLLDVAGVVASGTISLTLDNFQPTANAFCSSSNPTGCPEGHTDDPEMYKFFAPNASMLVQSGSPALAFSITPSRHDPMTIYIDNVTSNRFTFTTAGDRFVIGIDFETTGPEIRMNCIRNAACAFIDGRTIELAGPHADISFALAVQGGHVVYTDAVATFTTTSTDSDSRDVATAMGTAMTEKLMTVPPVRSGVASAIDSVLHQTASLSATTPIDAVSIAAGTVQVRPGCALE